ncbi:hypothetical protein ABZT34_30985 [Streptomyces sp. NPDC005329]|uniref:hypothetical protein n=1 Tax=Streptomyces sp. NPDC005329 TaxID=3157034 RepID=UPI0033ABAD0F
MAALQGVGAVLAGTPAQLIWPSGSGPTDLAQLIFPAAAMTLTAAGPVAVTLALVAPGRARGASAAGRFRCASGRPAGTRGRRLTRPEADGRVSSRPTSIEEWAEGN